MIYARCGARWRGAYRACGFVPFGGDCSFAGRIRHSLCPAELFYTNPRTQKGHPFGWPSALFDAWQFPTLAWGDPTLPSALRRFTSEFGMWSGGTTALLPPGKFCVLSCVFCADTALAAFAKVSHIPQYAPSFASFAALSQRKILRTLNLS